MKRTVLALFLICSPLIYMGIAVSQVATGTPRFNSFGGGPFDTVNLGNLNVHFAIPIINKSGRGLPFSYDLTYDSSIWSPVGVSGSQTWSHSGTWGWQSATPSNATPYLQYSQHQSSVTRCGIMNQGSWYIIYYDGFVYHDQFGNPHPFGGGAEFIVVNNCAPPNSPPPGPQPTTPQTLTASDGSYSIALGVATQNGISGSLFNCDGQTINAPWLTAPPTQSANYNAVDSNGNKISFTASTGQFTDTLGQTVLTVSGSNPVTYTYTGQTNNAISWQLNYSTFNVKTNFTCSGIAQATISNVLLASSLSLPDGTSYSFTYEPTPGFSGYVTGRIKSVTLPTGGSITYAYTGANNGIICADGSAAGLTRTVNPGGTWTYSRTQVSGSHWQTTISSPPDSQNSGSASDQTIIDFQQDYNTGIGATYSFYETQRKAYQGTATGTPLLTSTTCWNGTTTNCTTTALTSPITQRNVTAQSNGGLQSETDTYINACGLVSKADQYGYVATGTGPLLRETNISFAALGNNIADRPSVITVTDGSSNLLSKTTYAYDETAYPLNTSLTGTPQHQSITGSRGNATTVTSTVIGTTTLTRHSSYYDTGNVYQAYDVNGAITTYNYANSTSTCGNTFPSSATLPISGLSTSSTWDCIGGVASSSTDANGNAVNVTYTNQFSHAGDPFWRLQAATDPLSNTTLFLYSATSVQSSMTFNSGNSAVGPLINEDGFGRPILTQTGESPNDTTHMDTIVQAYDNFGRPYSSGLPCVAAAGSGCTSATTTTVYDALNRVVNVTDGGNPTPGYVNYTYNQNDVKQVLGPAPTGESLKQKQLEYDALGRLTSVCELNSLTGSGQCGQTNLYTGYMTTYAYGINGSGYFTTTVTQGATGSQQTRVYTYDLLGRLVSEQNPENGSTTYVYDSWDSSCGTYSSPGDLVEKKDAVGNYSCMKYDALHRVTQTTYPVGTYKSPVTPTKCFVYDSATVNNNSMANAKTRLAEAYTTTASSCPSTASVDEGFSYSPRGELTDVWESTPNSGGFYHTAASYWANGTVNILAGYLASGSTFVPTQTYTPDGAGRWKSVAAASGPNPISTIAYNAASQITGITYGSTDTDAFTYDPNTDRMTQYKYTLNGSSEISNLTWNANGTLQTLAITDPFNSSNAQNCAYGYDDLARITSANCGTAWSQSFSYDPFGNLTKTGSINWQPGYNQTNNHYSLGGTTYDADGNLTNDSFHSYAWDSNGRPVSMGGKTMTYDALGRMVEKLDGGVYTQFVYSPSGSLLARMSGQSATSVRVPTPGSWAVYGSSSSFNHYEHLDWLGNSRLSSNQSRQMTSDIAYAPFGEPYASTATSGVSFTGMRSDVIAASGGVTNGLYDFLARELPPTQGRWISPDPAGLAAVDPTNPQSWNRYAYVTNNPLTFADPLGLWSPGCPPGSTATSNPDGTQYCSPNVDSGTMPGCIASGTEGCIPFPSGPITVSLGGGSSGGGGGSSGGGGGSGVDQAKKQAVNALKDPRCTNAVAGNSAGGARAAATLGAQNGADPLASIAFGDLGPGVGVSTTGTPVMFPNAPGIAIPNTFGPPVTMTINTNATTGFFNGYVRGYELIASQAIGLLHDTGHAAFYNHLRTAVVTPDGGQGLTQTAIQNNETIGDACFPQGDFGGNQGSISQEGPVPAAVVAAHSY